jgi:nitrilase
MSTTSVAVVQAGSILLDTEASLGKAERLIGEAAANGARLTVFPEAFIGGYPKGADFGVRIGSRSQEGRALFRRYFESAVEVPGRATARLGAAAREHGSWVVIGVIERAAGTLYCTVLFFSPGGALAGRHRKLVPTAMERVIWGCGDGSTLPVIDTGFGRIGAAVCWENYMPLLRAALYAKGIELYCAPTVDDRDTWVPTMRHIALEGRCYVLSACQFVTAASPSESIRGGSLIVGPLGEVLAGPHYGGERILTADIDTSRIAEGKFDLDVSGHYARPDVFRLEVNESPALPVTFTE